MKKLLLFVFLFLLTTVFFSCKTFTVQKRHYNKGVYISCNSIFNKILYSNNNSSRHKETKLFSSNDSDLIKTILDNKLTERLYYIITPVDTPPKSKTIHKKRKSTFIPETYIEPNTYSEDDCEEYVKAMQYYWNLMRTDTSTYIRQRYNHYRDKMFTCVELDKYSKSDNIGIVDIVEIIIGIISWLIVIALIIWWGAYSISNGMLGWFIFSITGIIVSIILIIILINGLSNL